jgi:acyl carrier protein
MEEKIRQLMAEVFEMKVTDLPASFNQSDVENWDSLHHLNLIVELESVFNVSFEPEEINEMTSFEKVLKSTSKKLDDLKK